MSESSAPTVPTATLNDGHEMPAIGFGTYPLKDEEAVAVVGDAITAGYRMIDTASRYENEGAVGRAVAVSEVSREELFVTSKLAGRSHGYEPTMIAFDDTMSDLGLDYLDLYLIHWPLPRIDEYVGTWRAFVELREQGRVRSIGVSNFLPEHVDRLVEETGAVPAVNQVELHPQFPQAEQRAYDAGRAIVTQSWSPLGRGSDLLADPAVTEVATAHGVTPAQVVLRWHHQLGAVPLPKSGNPDRLRSNLDVFGFALTDDEMQTLASVETGVRLGGDPAAHEEF